VDKLRDEFTYDSPVCLSPQKRIAPSSDSHGSRKRLATGGGVTREAQEDLAPARLPPRKSSRRLSARGGGGGRGQRAYCGQEHARRHRMPNHRPLPLRSSTTASCATPLPSCHERPIVPLLTFPHSRAPGFSVLSTRFRPIHVVQIRGLRVLRARRLIPMSAGIWVSWMSCIIRENVVTERRVVVEERRGREFHRRG